MDFRVCRTAAENAIRIAAPFSVHRALLLPHGSRERPKVEPTLAKVTGPPVTPLFNPYPRWNQGRR